MTDYKEFEGNTVDEAIKKACQHFGLEREKLEIEILHGGSRGIFGLGKKAARVNARKRGTGTENSFLDNEFFSKELRRPTLGGDTKKQKAPAKHAQPKAESPRPAPTPKPAAAKMADTPRPAQQEQKAPQPAAEQTQPSTQQPARSAAPTAEANHPQPRPDSHSAPKPEQRPQRTHAESPSAPSEAELDAVVRNAIIELLKPIAPSAKLSLTHEPGRVKVRIDDDANSGLIIGREGQTIAALQYLANRIVSRHFDSAIRIHLDAGDYRDKQDDNLRKMALHLADKARHTGRTQSTKPLSSYHRRLVHLALQDDETIQTRSKGDGPLKRVLIFPRRERSGRQNR